MFYRQHGGLTIDSCLEHATAQVDVFQVLSKSKCKVEFMGDAVKLRIRNNRITLTGKELLYNCHLVR